ncbi:perlucin-like protein isoform X2 [Penaeus japonicus]|nr:perlucin-like protein isoform X2 [Penaeus japonicus]XP_042888270.1 perlucin-like protein isoform X2 [Penaeus japonicus]
MKSWFVLLLAGGFCVAALSVPALPKHDLTCPPPSENLDGHCILVDMVNMGVWHDMRAACQAQGGDMAKVHDPNFMAALIDHIQCRGYNEEFYWLGGTDEEREDHWKWVDGTDIKMGFPLWFHCEGVVEPNSGSRANCLVTAKNAYYYLRDQNCINYYHPVCEFPAEGEGPTSTTAATTSPTGTTAPSPTTTAIFTTSERPSSTTPLA